jgi:hypothetical protein
LNNVVVVFIVPVLRFVHAVKNAEGDIMPNAENLACSRRGLAEYVDS